MAGLKIQNAPQQTAITGAEKIPVADGVNAKHIDVSDLVSYTNENVAGYEDLFVPLTTTLIDTGAIDLDFTKTLSISNTITITQATTFTFSNAVIGHAYEVNIIGDFALSFPTEFSKLGSHVYEGISENSIYIICKNDTVGSERFDYTISIRS